MSECVLGEGVPLRVGYIAGVVERRENLFFFPSKYWVQEFVSRTTVAPF